MPTTTLRLAPLTYLPPALSNIPLNFAELGKTPAAYFRFPMLIIDPTSPDPLKPVCFDVPNLAGLEHLVEWFQSLRNNQTSSHTASSPMSVTSTPSFLDEPQGLQGPTPTNVTSKPSFLGELHVAAGAPRPYLANTLRDRGLCDCDECQVEYLKQRFAGFGE